MRDARDCFPAAEQLLINKYITGNNDFRCDADHETNLAGWLVKDELIKHQQSKSSIVGHPVQRKTDTNSAYLIITGKIAPKLDSIKHYYGILSYQTDRQLMRWTV